MNNHELSAELTVNGRIIIDVDSGLHFRLGNNSDRLRTGG